MAIEYAGYIPNTETTNWASLTGDLAKTISDIGEDRQKQKDALDLMMKDNESLMNSYELGKSQTMNTMVLKGAEEGRAKIVEWNKLLKAGKLSPNEYKERMNNVKDYWGVLATSAQTNDKRYADALQRQQDGTASQQEFDYIQQYGSMVGMEDNKIHFSDSGKIYTGKVDPKTGLITGELFDVRALNLPQNIVQNKTDVNKLTAEAVKGWEATEIWKQIGGGGEMNISDPRIKKEYALAVQSVIESISPNSDPRSQLSVLIDNGGMSNYATYKTEEEYGVKLNAKLEELNQKHKDAGIDPPTKEEIDAIKLGMVKMTISNDGTFTPVLTEEQQKLSKEVVRRAIEMQLGRKESGTPSDYSSGKSSSSSSDDDKKDNRYAINAYTSAQKAIKEGNFDAFDNENYDFKKGTDKAGKNYVLVTPIKYKSDGFRIPIEGKRVYDPTGMAKYSSDKKVSDNPGNVYNLGKENYRKSKGGYYGEETTKEEKKPRTEISRNEIASKAKAAGYTVQEYEKLLKEKGITIK